ncbi:hypothetical protein GCM10023318_37850 [Nocardia callitridis]|uniref:Uncharacterized protein n=1 Tax=Nocardia callitridis TaxID=648753 RepID=A0ABP9KJR9_9NOCA
MFSERSSSTQAVTASSRFATSKAATTAARSSLPARRTVIGAFIPQTPLGPHVRPSRSTLTFDTDAPAIRSYAAPDTETTSDDGVSGGVTMRRRRATA